MKPVLTIDEPTNLDLNDGVWAEPEGVAASEGLTEIALVAY